MDDKKLHRCFTFSEEQLKHLRSKKYKIDRMECFMSLVDLAEPDFSLILVLQLENKRKRNKALQRYNKIRKLTPFGGIFSIMEKFDSTLSYVIDTTLGLKAYLCQNTSPNNLTCRSLRLIVIRQLKAGEGLFR